MNFLQEIRATGDTPKKKNAPKNSYLPGGVETEFYITKYSTNTVINN